MVFADNGSGAAGVTALLSGIAAVIGAIVVGLRERAKSHRKTAELEAQLEEMRAKLQSEEDETAIGHWRLIVKDKDKQIARQEKHIKDQQEVITELTVAVERRYAWMQRANDWMERCFRCSADDERTNLGAPPVLPRRPGDSQDVDRAQFLARSTQQNTTILQTPAVPEKPQP